MTCTEILPSGETCGAPLVEMGPWLRTSVGFHSPPEPHDHDDNCITRCVRCEAGHKTRLSVQRRCPACEWVGKATCFCHAGDKLDAFPELPINEGLW